MPWKIPTHKPIAWRPPGAEQPRRTDPYYLSASWRSNRQQVLARDRHTCQIRKPGCWGYATLVDHIQARTEGGSDDLMNLRAACPACHNRRHPEKGRRSSD